MTKDELIQVIEKMTVLELAELVKALEERFGVSAAAPVAAVAAVAAAPVADEKTEFNVVLKDSGAKKIDVIKVIRTVLNLGLKEAKDIADNPPKTIKENCSKEEAESIKKQLVEAGATVELQ